MVMASATTNIESPRRFRHPRLVNDVQSEREREREREMAGTEGEIYQRIQAHLTHHGTKNLRAVDESSSYRCGLCLTPGFGPRYSCGVCNLSIHRICGSHIKSQPCFLHPENHFISPEIVRQGAMQCYVCGEHISGCHYKCEDPAQDARVHPTCLQLRHASAAIARSDGRLVSHFGHGHALKELYLPKQYACDGCGTPGLGLRLRCGDCDFNLHPYCFSCPRSQPCFLGHTQHPCRLMIVAGSWKLQCHLCGGTIGRSDTCVGMYYVCDISNAFAHPLCVQLQHKERGTSSEPSQSPDGVAKLLTSACRVAGKIALRKFQVVLLLGAFNTGSYFWEQFQASGDAGEAASATLEHVADGISDKMDSVHEAVSTVAGDIADTGESLAGTVASAIDFLSNFF